MCHWGKEDPLRSGIGFVTSSEYYIKNHLWHPFIYDKHQEWAEGEPQWGMFLMFSANTEGVLSLHGLVREILPSAGVHRVTSWIWTQKTMRGEHWGLSDDNILNNANQVRH